MTVLYQAWKNSKADIKGLCHYRRFFCNCEKPLLTGLKYTNENKVKKLCIGETFIEKTLNSYDMILQMPCEPYPQNAKSDLLTWCYPEDIATLEDVIRERYPEYVESFQATMECKFLSYCNMIIAKKEIYDAYCSWLFGVLEEVEKHCDISNYDAQHKRIYGYLAEVLLNVYVRKHKLSVKYLAVLYVEDINGKMSLKDMIRKVNLRVFDVLEKNKLQGIGVFLLRLCKKTMYEKYVACKMYFSEDRGPNSAEG